IAHSGSSTAIASAARIPPPGILMSRRQTSGCSWMAAPTASSASAASAQTEKPPRSRALRAPKRASGWSSASRTRRGAAMGAPPLPSSPGPGLCRDERVILLDTVVQLPSDSPALVERRELGDSPLVTADLADHSAEEEQMRAEAGQVSHIHPLGVKRRKETVVGPAGRCEHSSR